MADEIKAYPLDVELLEAVLDYLPIGAILVDDEGIIRRFNRYEEQLSGLSRTKTIGRSFFSDIAPCTKDIELGPRFREGIERKNLDINVEFSFPYPYNRVPRDVHIRAVSVRSSTGHANVVLIEDITSRRQLQRNNADMMLGLQAMVARWRGGEKNDARDMLAFGSAAAFEEQAIVLYADVSGFAEIARRTPPAELFSVIDSQLKTAIEIICRRGGHIDQVNGNGVVGIFLPGKDGERAFHDAARAAMEIAERSAQFLKLPFRMGLAMGTVYNGPIGQSELGNRTTIGEPILVARSLAQVGRAKEVIMTQELVERLGNSLTSSELSGVVPAGIRDPGPLYKLEALDLPQA
jgi:photoactive yellow protein